MEISRNLLQYWYSIIKEKKTFKSESHELTKQLNMLVDHYFNFFGEWLNEKPQDDYTLILLKLRVPLKHYNIDYEEIISKGKAPGIEEIYNCLYHVSKKEKIPSMEIIAAIYRDLLDHSSDLGLDREDTIEALNSIDNLLNKLIPKPAIKHFSKLITFLEKESALALEDGEEIGVMSKKPTLKIKDAKELLKKLENEKYSQSDSDKKIMNHPSFKVHKSGHIKYYRDQGFVAAFEILDKEGILPLDRFFKMCGSPSTYFHEFIIKSFEAHCNQDNPRYAIYLYKKCSGRKLDVGKRRIGENKEMIKVFILK